MTRRSFVFLSLLSIALCFLPTPTSAQPTPPPDLTIDTIVEGLTNPLAVRHAGDGSGRTFVAEQNGKIWVNSGGLLPNPFLDLQGQVRLLFGLAFDPDYATNGLFYVCYSETAGPEENVVVERFSVSGDPNVADAASGERLLVVPEFSAHQGGDIHFGPDGYLWVGLGDGGSDSSLAQDPTTLLGKMLRIGVGAGPGYSIPPDNPHVGDAGVLDEIVFFGFRNPYRWSFDRDTGHLLISDVGESTWEEVSFVPGTPTARNFGWPCREGAHDFNPGTPGCGGPYADPVIEFEHGPECAVIGGFVYRGPIAPLDGTYVYGDWCTGQIWLATESDGWTPQLFTTVDAMSLVGFGEDEAGDLYATIGETVGRFTSASSSLIFADGFGSGTTAAWSATVP